MSNAVRLFRKKPIVIEAIQWEGDIESLEQIEKFMGIKIDWDGTDEFIIPTLEDGKNGQVEHVATVWDWIIKGVNGEFYPCKDEIFEQTYEKA